MIYFDHNATTPVREEVLEAMLPFLQWDFGNPSSVHAMGSRARCAVEEARASVADAVRARPASVVFTSGGTESLDLALSGLASSLPAGRLVTTPLEHAAVLEPLRALAAVGWEVTWLSVDGEGCIDPEDLRRVLDGRPAVVSIGWANNEIGALPPLAELSAICRAAGAWLHSDAVQAVGKVPVDASLVDLLSFSSHKLGGPKGAGALVVRDDVPLSPRVRGGGQERGRRGGTENVPAIVGFGEACRLLALEGGLAPEVEKLREQLWQTLSSIPGVHRHGSATACLPNTLNLRFEGVRGEALVAALDLAGIAVSAGSACAAGAGEPSHVLQALGCTESESRDGVRFSLGRGNTAGEVAAVTEAVREAVARIRRVGAAARAA